ncbi:AMP-binding protein [Pseudoalteromonas viridis]|uniref:AMP-binding protein n=1 Tax=Pseudoalteromonas viridis TaxID=339617 RepID=A0ABX7V9Z7_9GAMM|nr:AMP-binding protein [Pseudoalteromonas viridis]QTL37734.1 AMP-binding protein [Pseudoalteromonas viridis]
MNDLTTKQRALSAFKSRVISQLGCDELVHEQLQIATDSVLNPDTLKYHIGGLFHLQGDFCPQDLIKQITLVFNHLCGESELDLDMTQALADKTQARTFAEQFKQRPFDLEHGALVRIALRPALQGGYFVVLIAHHILLDGLSLYRLFCKALAMLPLSVTEITTELAQMRYHNTHKHTARHLAFWQTYLQDLPDFMFDYIPPAQAGTQTLSAHFSVSNTQIQALHSLCQQHNVGFHVYIAHLLGEFYQHHFNQSVVVGYALNNQRRNQHNYGMSSKLLPQIVKPAGQTFIESIKALQWDFNQLFRKSQVPIGEINQCAAVSASARTLVYDVMINYLNPGALMNIDGVDLASEMLVQSDHSHPISVNLVHNEHSNMEVMLSANPTFVTPAHLQQLATLLENALHLGAQQTLQFNATDNGAVEETPTAPQWQFMRGKSHPLTPADLPAQVIETLSKQAPESIAICDHQGQTFSYQWLQERQQRIARWLLSNTLAQHNVAVLMEHTADMVATMLACLHTGRVIVPVNADADVSYAQDILARAQAACVMVDDPRWASALSQFNVATIESVIDAPVSAPEQAHRQGVCLDSLAYLVFSSGTTGVPKGIMLAQRTLANLCLHHRLDPNLSTPAQVLNTTALGFDVAIQTLLTTLCCGGTLHLTTSNVRKEAANILDNVAGNHISRLIVTPSLLHILAAQASFSTHTFDTLEQVIVSGEQMVMSEQVRAFLNRSGATLINQYGPAETHVVTQHSLHDLAALANGDAVPIGRPICNVRLAIQQTAELNSDSQGVLYIGGPSVALEYIQAPQLSAERFVHLPVPANSALFFNSRDRVITLPGGRLLFSGREDDSVKVRGRFVNLKTVEKLLMAIDDVAEACATTYRSHGVMRLLAFVTLSGQRSDAAALNIRQTLLDNAPNWLVPDTLVPLECFPRTANGKVDTKALLAEFEHMQQTCAPTQAEHANPVSEIEQQVLAVLAQKCGVHPHTLDEDLRTCGMDSLSIIIYMTHLSETFGLQLNTDDFIAHPSVAAISAHIRTAQASALATAISGQKVKKLGKKHAPATFTQSNIFRQWQQGNLYNMFQCFAVHGSVCPERMRQAFARLVSNTGLFNSRFEMRGDTLWCCSNDADVVNPFEHLDLSHLAHEAAHEALERQCSQQKSHRFALEQGELIHAQLLTLGNKQQYLLLNIHHIITDAVSNINIIGELKRYYDQQADNQPDKESVDFFDYAWEEQRFFSCTEGQQIVSDYQAEFKHHSPYPKFKHLNGALWTPSLYHTQNCTLPGFFAHAASQNGVSQIQSLIGALCQVFSPHLMTPEILMAVTFTGRTSRETRDMIGPLYKVAPLLVKPDETLDFSASVASGVAKIYNECVPEFTQVITDPALSEYLPYFKLNYITNSNQLLALDFDGFELQPEDHGDQEDVIKNMGVSRRVPLNIVAVQSGEDLVMHWHYVAGALSDAMITNMCAGFVRLLSSAEAPTPLQRCAK